MSSFEHYILTRVTSPTAGLTDVHESSFQPLLGSASIGYADDASSEMVDIGFDFLFDDKTYKKIVVNTNGWVALVDPTENSVSDVQTSLMAGSSWQNEQIHANLTTDSVLLCAWFDDLRNVGQVSSDAITNATTRLRQRYGYDVPSILYNNAEFGVKMFRQENSRFGRRTIVRWNSLSDYGNASTVIKFELVLYENGMIEYRYVPRRSITLYETTSGGNFIEDATIGIFAPGTNRFRDFSWGLGRGDDARQQYEYGGAVYSSTFTDEAYDTYSATTYAKEYVWTLRPATHWPGLSTMGTIFKFSPPSNRRKTLPRKLIRELDSTKETSLERFYDDRKSAPYISGVVVNYPTTLPRFFGDSEPGVTLRQDLFSSKGNELSTVGCINKNAIEQYINVSDDGVIKPFNETNLWELSTEQFFSSSASENPTFDAPLRSKSQIKFSLPINYSTKMFEITSSIYYYNTRHKAWLMPDNTTTSTTSDVALASSDATNRRVLEDHRGFGPIGTLLGSGSNNVDNTGSVAARAIGHDHYVNYPYYDTQIGIDAMSQPLAKSIFVNPEYSATADETIKFQSDVPFLVEKAVIEIPFAFGAGWFNSKTTSFLPLTSSSIGAFDFAGPGITFSLFNQINSGNSTRRELVLTGTITHTNDMISTVEISNFPSLSNTYQVRPVGFLSYASNPAAVVSPDSSNSFTGSVALTTEALTSNGLILRMSKDMNAEPSTEYPTNRQQVLSLLKQETIQLESGSGLYSVGLNVAFVNPFGRGGSYLTPSGRSYFGRDFVTTQNIVTDNKVRNPLYVTGSSYQTLSASLSGSTYRAISALPLLTHARSPYLLLPGDSLVFAISKSRPFYYSNGLGGPETSGSIQHDVDLITGSINVTLYGSYVRNTQALDNTQFKNETKSIKTVIGNDPVLDQYEVEYREQRYGSMSDDYITGSMVALTTSPEQQLKFVTSSRGKVFSNIYARNQQTPGTSSYEISVNPSKAFRLQPWWEKTSVDRNVSLFDTTERIYDSLLPSLATCFKADGTSIWLTEVNIYNVSTRMPSASIGRIQFDASFSGSIEQKLRNGNWTKSFPYEPRYANASRQTNISKSFIATLLVKSGSTIEEIEPVLVDSLMPGTIGPTRFSSGPEIPFDYIWFADCSLAVTNSFGYYLTSSATTSDITKVCFGFGDQNTSIISANGKRFGTNNWPDHRDVSEYRSYLDNQYEFSPVIRGWKYGVYNGLPTFSKIVYRRSSYGQLRDMLEQRQFTKFYMQRSDETKKLGPNTVSVAAVQVSFVDSQGNPTNAENTSSQNLSFEATSSFPYFDGETRNRNKINKNTQNTTVMAIKADRQGNISL